MSDELKSTDKSEASGEYSVAEKIELLCQLMSEQTSGARTRPPVQPPSVPENLYGSLANPPETWVKRDPPETRYVPLTQPARIPEGLTETQFGSPVPASDVSTKRSPLYKRQASPQIERLEPPTQSPTSGPVSQLKYQVPRHKASTNPTFGQTEIRAQTFRSRTESVIADQSVVGQPVSGGVTGDSASVKQPGATLATTQWGHSTSSGQQQQHLERDSKTWWLPPLPERQLDVNYYTKPDADSVYKYGAVNKRPYGAIYQHDNAVFEKPTDFVYQQGVVQNRQTETTVAVTQEQFLSRRSLGILQDTRTPPRQLQSHHQRSHLETGARPKQFPPSNVAENRVWPCEQLDEDTTCTQIALPRSPPLPIPMLVNASISVGKGNGGLQPGISRSTQQHDQRVYASIGVGRGSGLQTSMSRSSQQQDQRVYASIGVGRDSDLQPSMLQSTPSQDQPVYASISIGRGRGLLHTPGMPGSTRPQDQHALHAIQRPHLPAREHPPLLQLPSPMPRDIPTPASIESSQYPYSPYSRHQGSGRLYVDTSRSGSLWDPDTSYRRSYSELLSQSARRSFQDLVTGRNYPEPSGQSRYTYTAQKRTKATSSLFECQYCKNNKETKELYTSHRTIVAGIVTCPVLRKYVCPTCGATGDNAHTASYCPVRPKQSMAPLYQMTKRKSCGCRRSADKNCH